MTLFGLALTAPIALLPELQSTWHADTPSLALVLAAFLLGAGIASIVDDIALERFGPSGVLVAGLSGLCVACGALGLATNIAVATGAAIVFGFTGGLVDSGASARLATLLNRSERASAGLGHLSFAIGAITGPIYAVWLAQTRLGWRGAVIGLSIGAGILALVVWRTCHVQVIVAVDHGPANSGRWRRWPIALGSFGAAASVGASLAFSSWLVFDLVTWRRLPLFWAAVALSLFWTTLVVGRLANHWLALHVVSVRLVWSSSLVTASAFVALPFIADRRWLFVIIAVAGLASAVQFPSIASWVASSTSGERPVSTGLLVTAADAGGVACILVVGRLATVSPANLPAWPSLPPTELAGFTLSMAALAGISVVVAAVFQVLDRRAGMPARPLGDDERSDTAPAAL